MLSKINVQNWDQALKSLEEIGAADKIFSHRPVKHHLEKNLLIFKIILLLSLLFEIVVDKGRTNS